MPYYFDVDLGAIKTHALIVDETGRTLSYGESGSGNHEDAGCDGVLVSIRKLMEDTISSARNNSARHS